MTLFDVVFSGNDTVYGLTEKAIDDAVAKHGADKAIAFPDTAYSLPCYYGVTGSKAVSYTHLDVYKRQKIECPYPPYNCTADFLCKQMLSISRIKR